MLRPLEADQNTKSFDIIIIIIVVVIVIVIIIIIIIIIIITIIIIIIFINIIIIIVTIILAECSNPSTMAATVRGAIGVYLYVHLVDDRPLSAASRNPGAEGRRA